MDVNQYMQGLEMELNDAYRVIGRQQVAIDRQAGIIQTLHQEKEQLERQVADLTVSPNGGVARSEDTTEVKEPA